MLPMYNAGVDRFYRSNLRWALFAPKNGSVEHFLCSFSLGWNLKRRSQPCTSPCSASSSCSWGIATEDGPVSDSVPVRISINHGVKGSRQQRSLSQHVCERCMDHCAPSKSGRDYCGMSGHFTIWRNRHNSALTRWEHRPHPSKEEMSYLRLICQLIVFGMVLFTCTSMIQDTIYRDTSQPKTTTAGIDLLGRILPWAEGGFFLCDFSWVLYQEMKDIEMDPQKPYNVWN